MLKKNWQQKRLRLRFRLRIKKFYLYKCSGPPNYRIEELKDYIKSICPKAGIYEREDFFSFFIKKEPSFNIDDLAKKITLCRIHDVNEEVKEFSPLALEIDYEKKRLKQDGQLQGIIYDGFKLQSLYKSLIKPEEQTLSFCHIILTNQLLGTFDKSDKRYHFRVGIYGFPNIISTSGIIEALAKPRDYYLKMQMGIGHLTLKEEFGEQIIDYEDKRITELLKGYYAQALFYQTTGEPFCKDMSCRLYNAHWQKDALFAQIQSQPDFCPKHSSIIFG